jgi:opacity protein-like surface antigen
MKAFILKMTLLSAILLVKTETCSAVDFSKDSVYLNSCPGIYVRGFGGVNLIDHPRWHHTKWHTNVGYVVGGALGCQFKPLRIEGEFAYRCNDVNRVVIDALKIEVSGHVKQWCGFGNIFFEIPVTNFCLPYIGAGAGYRHTKPGVNFDERSDISFQNFIDSVDEWGVYQGIAGIKFATPSGFSMQIEYHYVDGWGHEKTRNHTVDLSAMLQF